MASRRVLFGAALIAASAAIGCGGGDDGDRTGAAGRPEPSNDHRPTSRPADRPSPATTPGTARRDAGSGRRGEASAPVGAASGGGGAARRGDRDAAAPRRPLEEVAQAVREAANALADGDGPRACALLSPNAQGQIQAAAKAFALDATDCAPAVAKLAGLLPPDFKNLLRDPRVEQVRIRGKTAGATIPPPKKLSTLAGGAKQPATRVPLRNIGGAWKLDALPRQ